MVNIGNAARGCRRGGSVARRELRCRRKVSLFRAPGSGIAACRWLICNKNEEKSEKNFVVSEIIANFAPKCLESIHSILTF